jgi:hypothetical protein
MNTQQVQGVPARAAVFYAGNRNASAGKNHMALNVLKSLLYFISQASISGNPFDLMWESATRSNAGLSGLRSALILKSLLRSISWTGALPVLRPWYDACSIPLVR